LSLQAEYLRFMAGETVFADNALFRVKTNLRKGMQMPTKLINPMNETPVRVSVPPARLRSLQGKTVGLLDISKTGGNLFLDRLELLLRERFHVASVMRMAKPTFAKPAPPGIIEQLRSVDAVVEALAD
jgi:hypothetical protein